jgi:hypothetical protein
VEGFVPGQELYYWDLRPGDQVLIHARATVTRIGEKRYQLEATAAVRLSFASRNGGEIYYRTEGGRWQVSDDGLIPTQAAATRPVEVRVGEG